MEKIARGSFIASAQSVIFKSPVDKGIFKNNWFTDVNGVSYKTTSKADKGATSRINEAIGISATVNIGDQISIANNLPYAVPLEYGSSEQAPNGMVRLTAAQWPQTVDKVTRALK